MFVLFYTFYEQFVSHFRPPVNRMATICTSDQKKLRPTKAHPSKPGGSVHTPVQHNLDNTRSTHRTLDLSPSEVQRHKSINPASSTAAPPQRTNSCSRSKEWGAAQPLAIMPAKKLAKVVKKGRKVNNGIADR